MWLPSVACLDAGANCQSRVEAIERDRDQLWAEAAAACAAGEQWWPDRADEKLFQAEQDKRFCADTWDGLIARLLEHQTSPVSAETILRDVVLAPVDKWNGQSKGRVTKVMHRYGWTKHRPRCGPKEAPEDSNSERHARADVYYPPVDARRLNPNDDTAGRPGVGDDEVGNNV